MQTSAYETSQVNILIIDQNREALALLESVLSCTSKYQVTTAEDGLDGLEKFQRGNFQLILTDLSTQPISGWELGRIVKKTAPAVRVALVTGWDFGAKPDHSPFDAIIPKPFQFDEFRGVIDSLLRYGAPASDLAEMSQCPSGKQRFPDGAGSPAAGLGTGRQPRDAARDRQAV